MFIHVYYGGLWQQRLGKHVKTKNTGFTPELWRFVCLIFSRDCLPRPLSKENLITRRYCCKPILKGLSMSQLDSISTGHSKWYSNKIQRLANRKLNIYDERLPYCMICTRIGPNFLAFLVKHWKHLWLRISMFIKNTKVVF